jgi:hypothetical protein
MKKSRDVPITYRLSGCVALLLGMLIGGLATILIMMLLLR